MTQDDPAAKFMHENAIKPDFCTLAMHEQIEQWMDRCFNHHDRCLKAGSSNIPTRLLHILEGRRIITISGDMFPKRAIRSFKLSIGRKN